MLRRVAAYLLRKRAEALAAGRPERAVYVWLKRAREVARRVIGRR